jgi:hypothetical protein
MSVVILPHDPWTISYTHLLARLNSLVLCLFQPPHIRLCFRAVTRRVRLAARITHVVHPDCAVEFNVVGLDLLGDGVDLEDVYAANGERD